MRASAAERRHEAGVQLWQEAEQFKQYREDLTNEMAFKLAILNNPILGEMYLGQPVRRDGKADIQRVLYSPFPLKGNEI
jgi:hypothetical protein